MRGGRVLASPKKWERREHRPPGRSAAERAALVETTSNLTHRQHASTTRPNTTPGTGPPSRSILSRGLSVALIWSRFRTTFAIAVLVVAAAMIVGGVGYSLTGEELDAAIVPVTNAPIQYTGSGDKLIPIPDEPGSYWIDERLMIVIERDVADPEAAIAEIGRLYGGIVVETSSGLRVFGGRFDGRDPSALEDQSSEIAERADVESATRDLKVGGLGLFSADRPPEPSD